MITFEDIKREAFRRAGVSSGVQKVASEKVDVEKLASRLESIHELDPSSDDGLLYEYEQMFKKAQAKAAERLGLVNGHITLRPQL